MITLRMDSRLPHVEKIGNVTIYRIGFTFAKELQKYLFPITGFSFTGKIVIAGNIVVCPKTPNFQVFTPDTDEDNLRIVSSSCIISSV
jgi:hypothetical protein